MQQWYNKINNRQKRLVWGISIGLILIWGIGLIPLSILMYLKLGSNNA